QTAYLVARCHDPEDRHAVAERLRQRYPDMAVLTSEEFSLRTRLYWLTKTRAGLVLAFAAVLGLIVGAVITGQTLYAATAAARPAAGGGAAVRGGRGAPGRRMAGLVLAQCSWGAAGGTPLPLPISLGLARLGVAYGVEPQLPPLLLLVTGAVTTAVALLSG